jgi:translation initiation factor IF-2
MMMDNLIGKVIHYYDKIGVAVIVVTGKLLTVGSKVKISGHDAEFNQQVVSLQIEHQNVNQVKNGQEAGMKVDQPVKAGDNIYKVPDDGKTI